MHSQWYSHVAATVKFEACRTWLHSPNFVRGVYDYYSHIWLLSPKFVSIAYHHNLWGYILNVVRRHAIKTGLISTKVGTMLYNNTILYTAHRLVREMFKPSASVLASGQIPKVRTADIIAYCYQHAQNKVWRPRKRILYVKICTSTTCFGVFLHLLSILECKHVSTSPISRVIQSWESYAYYIFTYTERHVDVRMWAHTRTCARSRICTHLHHSFSTSPMWWAIPS